jgi:hypothetical protein
MLFWGAKAAKFAARQESSWRDLRATVELVENAGNRAVPSKGGTI